MKICFMCDLHLPFDQNALQYDALKWATEDALKKSTDCIVFAGDATCDGNEAVYDFFIDYMQKTGIPFLYIPGNSDLRNAESRDRIKHKASPCKTQISGTTVYAINDCEGIVSEAQFSELESADGNSIVFMHHPMHSLEEDTRKRLMRWCENHKDTMLFYGHLHQSDFSGNSISLQAMDPDKAVGENPCITYYDTLTKELRKAYYFSPVPRDIYNYFGISCYNTEAQIQFAIENNLKNLELRPNCADAEQGELLKSIEKWRRAGGENLSVHLPDVGYADGALRVDKSYDKLIEIVKNLKADRITQHVPMVSVQETTENPDILDTICVFLAEKLNSVPHTIVVGVENMHMTAKDVADANRRFGYIPEECLQFMRLLDEKCRHKVGINFDIGHARNNAPFSQKYQIGAWLSMLGKYIVGYHIHQVSCTNGVFENHMPITDVYGHLISYASFFKCWVTERINKAPVIFEMRPEDAYAKTLGTFNVHKNRKVFDIHSHTFYSHCGRDNPQELIKTAIQNGLTTFGICDHNHGIGKRTKQYLAEMKDLARRYADQIKLLCGIEIATIPDLYTIENTDEVKGFDYCLIEHITYAESIVKGDLFAFCKKLGILCGIAHTDLFAYCDMYGYDYREFFAEMAKNNIFWEMNVSYDSIHKYREHQYVLDFMNDSKKQQIIKDAGVYISIGFDSHRDDDYDGFKVHEMYDFLKKHNIKTADALFV